MINFLERFNASPQGTIQFLYHDDGTAPVPAEFSDPLALLGDIHLLALSPSQTALLRSAVENDLSSEGPEEIWRTRAFRKNVIYSFGTIV
jgi:hypothetical protein